MTLNFELVRGNERLECDFLVWRDITELARAFGWKPRSPNPVRPSLSKLMDDSSCAEVADEDAQSLAVAIRQCLWLLTTSQRLSRRQIARLLCLTANNDREGNSIGALLEEPARIAKFCCYGGFRMNLKRQRQQMPENRKLTEATDEVS
jgi:hypothetical protein